jgi:oligopeptide transport system substrate-binding protein
MIMYPVNKEFLESKGTGCKLGTPDVNNCSFGDGNVDSILYNGPFILTTNDSKSKIEMKKNANYWDKGNVFVDTVTLVYDDGSDSYSIMKGFENGTYSLAGLNNAWTDIADYQAKYEGKITESMTNAYAFGMNLNMYRQQYTKGWTTDEKLANANGERENTQAAIQNANFRNALIHALDRVAYLSQSVTEKVATDMLRNFNGVPELVSTSDGKSYGQLVTAAYDKMTGTTIDLADAQDPFLSKDQALACIEAAKADGIKFPVTLDMPYIGDGSDIYKNRAASMAKSISDNTNGQIIINAISKPREDVMNVCFYNENAATCDYDINTAGGWGPDFADPKTFADIYSAKDGYYMTVLGLYGTKTDAYKQQPADVQKGNDAALEASGLNEYTAMIEKADAIKDDLDARYAAYAEADAYLIAKGLFIPMQMQTRGLRVSKVVPFTMAYSVAGVGGNKYKYMKVQEEIVTEAEYNKAMEAWNKAR